VDIELHPHFRFVAAQTVEHFFLHCVEKEKNVISTRELLKHDIKAPSLKDRLHAGRRRPRGKDGKQVVYALV